MNKRQSRWRPKRAEDHYPGGIWVGFGAFAITILCWQIPAVAQEEATPNQRIVFGEMAVSGKVQKPEVEYIIARKDQLEEVELTLKRSFIPQLLVTVKQDPF